MYNFFDFLLMMSYSFGVANAVPASDLAEPAVITQQSQTIFDSQIELVASQGDENDRKKAIARLQETLKDRGCYESHIDGLLGPRTTRAVDRLEETVGISISKSFNSETTTDELMQLNRLLAKLGGAICDNMVSPQESKSHNPDRRAPREPRRKLSCISFEGVVSCD